jgi:hypothetical protein
MVVRKIVPRNCAVECALNHSRKRRKASRAFDVNSEEPKKQPGMPARKYEQQLHPAANKRYQVGLLAGKRGGEDAALTMALYPHRLGVYKRVQH